MATGRWTPEFNRAGVAHPRPARYQVALGAGMVHGLRLRDGNAHWYRNRWVRSADVARALGEKWQDGPHTGGIDFAANTTSSAMQVAPWR